MKKGDKVVVDAKKSKLHGLHGVVLDDTDPNKVEVYLDVPIGKGRRTKHENYIIDPNDLKPVE